MEIDVFWPLLGLVAASGVLWAATLAALIYAGWSAYDAAHEPAGPPGDGDAKRAAAAGTGKKSARRRGCRRERRAAARTLTPHAVGLAA